MNVHDWFVGGVSILTGAILAVAAMANSDAFFALNKPSWLARQIGRGRARLVCIALGLVFIGVGVAIAGGYRFNWS